MFRFVIWNSASCHVLYNVGFTANTHACMHPGKIPVQTQVLRDKPSLTLCCVAGLRLIWHYVVEILLKQAKATVLLPFLINPLISSSPFGEPMIPFCCYVSWTVNSFQGPEGSLYETLLFLTSKHEKCPREHRFCTPSAFRAALNR